MSSAAGRRRYLTNFDSQRAPHQFTDTLVIGSGVAGLRAALAAADESNVLVATKDDPAESATRYAQGGIAAAAASDDSPKSHAEDTLKVGCGLNDAAIVQLVVESAPEHIRELRKWGARFDSGGGGLALGREGGHSSNRIVHADGDATGREVVRVLLERVRRHPHIRLFSHCFVIDLLTRDGVCVGAVTHHPKYGHQMFWARTTVLASGGVGRVYRETTNPSIATGDGLAIALRAGAVVRDLEMIQFHPTTLYVAGAARALISEAVRGEGGRLLNRAGQRFMSGYDSRAELAPRDVVSRAITAEMKRERAPSVFLDVRHFPGVSFAERFPTINQICLDVDIDPRDDLIPVRPTAHYTVGGVIADARTRTALDGLLVCGEAASSGLHGANRLASNSLLEGLVFGRIAGEVAAERAAANGKLERPTPLSHLLPHSSRTELDLDDVRHSLQSVMARNVAIERSGDRLRETTEIIEFWCRYVLDKLFDERRAWETQNLLTVALAATRSAAIRCESRGVHYRVDFPQPDDTWRRHIDIHRADDEIQLATAPVEPASAASESSVKDHDSM